jgi:hypothetical protein
MRIGPARPQPTRGVETKASTQVHRTPRAAVPRQESRGDEDVAEDEWHEHDRGPPMDGPQDREDRTAMHKDETDAGHDECRQARHDRDVGEPLARVVVAFVSLEAAAEDRAWPAPQPDQIVSLKRERIADEPDDRPPGQDDPHRKQGGQRPTEPDMDLDIGPAEEAGDDRGFAFLAGQQPQSGEDQTRSHQVGDGGIGGWHVAIVRSSREAPHRVRSSSASP